MNKFGIKDAKNREFLIDMTDEESIEESKQLVSGAVLHACDISTSLRDFDIST